MLNELNIDFIKLLFNEYIKRYVNTYTCRICKYIHISMYKANTQKTICYIKMYVRNSFCMCCHMHLDYENIPIFAGKIQRFSD